MRRALRFLLTALATMAGPVPAMSAAVDELIEIEGKTPVTIRSDRAYILLRTNYAFQPLLLRVPTEAELTRFVQARAEAFAKAEPELRRKREQALARKAAAEAAKRPFTARIPPAPAIASFAFAYSATLNLQAIDVGRVLSRSGEERTVLVEAIPGTYVLYGAATTCLCLGTVSFPVEAGKVTDMGTILTAPAGTLEKSTIPELRNETGLGFSMNGHRILVAMALRPAQPGSALPAALAGAVVQPAELRAVGKFLSAESYSINRLPAIPGVLGYDRGTVLDLKSGKPAPDHY